MKDFLFVLFFWDFFGPVTKVENINVDTGKNIEVETAFERGRILMNVDSNVLGNKFENIVG
jgi:hypothetical protein